jgi:PAS domain-containing protein
VTPSTERTLLEDRLLKALLGQKHLGVAVCDCNGSLVMLSPALEAAVGASYCPTPASAWAGHYYLHDEAGAPVPAGEDPLARALRGEEISDEVLSVRRPDRPVRWIQCSGFSFRGESTGPIGAAVFVVDVTARVAERRRLDHLRDRLVDTVNHEVRTPLATMMGHLELVAPSAPALPPPVQWSLGAMARAADRLKEVVDTISDLAAQSQAFRDEPPGPERSSRP